MGYQGGGVSKIEFTPYTSYSARSDSKLKFINPMDNHDYFRENREDQT